MWGLRDENFELQSAEELRVCADLTVALYQFGWSALHHSANWGYAECVRVLLDVGADPDVQSESGKTAADFSAL